MKPKTMILMVVAVTCGLGASYMTSRLLAERTGPDEPDKVTVLVAVKAMNMGDIIKNPKELFKEKTYSRGEEPKEAINDYEQLKEKVLKLPLRPGDHVAAENLFADRDQYMDWRLPKGFRAVGIRVAQDTSAAGFASRPLSKVDIIATVRRGDDKTSFSGVLLQDVLVLAADTATQGGPDKQAMPASVVTVALKPEDAVKVELVKTIGNLSLVLRGFNEKKSEELAYTNVEKVFMKITGKKEVEEQTQIDNKSQPPEYTPPPLPQVVAKANAIPQPAQVETPAHKKHVLTLSNSGKQEVWEYILDDKDNIVGSRLVNVGGMVDTPAQTPPRPPIDAPKQANPKGGA